MLYLHTNNEKVLVTLSEDKYEFHLALSPEISLLQDLMAPILLYLHRPMATVCQMK